MKADDKEQFELDGKTESSTYSYFETLVAKVKVLQEQIEIMGNIMAQNNLTTLTKQYNMSPDIEDKTYRKLEEKND